MLGLAVWAAGFIFEIVADRQRVVSEPIRPIEVSSSTLDSGRRLATQITLVRSFFGRVWPSSRSPPSKGSRCGC